MGGVIVLFPSKENRDRPARRPALARPQCGLAARAALCAPCAPYWRSPFLIVLPVLNLLPVLNAVPFSNPLPSRLLASRIHLRVGPKGRFCQPRAKPWDRRARCLHGPEGAVRCAAAGAGPSGRNAPNVCRRKTSQTPAARARTSHCSGASTGSGSISAVGNCA